MIKTYSNTKCHNNSSVSYSEKTVHNRTETKTNSQSHQTPNRNCHW